MTTDNRKEKAYDYLYRAIVSYKLKPGFPIVEKDVSAALGTSRTPVREALKQLESEGLVRHIPGKGTFVSEVTLQDLEEIFYLREVLELAALDIAWDKVTHQELEKLEKLLLTLNENSSEEGFYESDRALHDLIVRCSGNRRLKNILNTINAQIERLRRIAVFSPDRPEKSRQEHLVIIESLKQRDYQKAKVSLQAHIQNVKENTMEVYRKYLFLSSSDNEDDQQIS